MAKELRSEWPYLSPDLEATIPAWTVETSHFIEATLGVPQRVAFKAAAEKGGNTLERLDSAADFLGSLSTGLTAPMVRADAANISTAIKQRRTGLVSHLYKMGDDLKAERAAPGAEQCAREDRAREWDDIVGAHLWGRPYLKRFAPGWKAAGAPIAKAAGYPNQSMKGAHELASWYQGKLDYLRTVIDTVDGRSAAAAAG